MEQRNLRGVTIAFDRVGNGKELIVFIHGVGADRTSWKYQLPFFAQQGYTAVAIDMRGSGDSSARHENGLLEPITREDFAQDVHALIGDLGFSKAHWVGNSMGGVIIQEALKQGLESIDRAVLCNTFAWHPEAATILPRASNALRTTSLEQFAAARIAMVLREGVEAEVLEEAIYAMARKDPESYLLSWRATWSPDYRELLPTFNVRSLVVTSDLDTATPAPLGEHLVSTIPNAQHLHITGAGHISNIDQPAIFNERVLAFLQQS